VTSNAGRLNDRSYKRLALRYDRTDVTIAALARPAFTLICARRLSKD